MMRKSLAFVLSSLLCLSGYSQELSRELREELAKKNPIFFEVWENRIPLRIEPNQRYPRNFEEAKHWLREASIYCLLADILRTQLKKPYEVWAPFYHYAIFLAKSIYEKFGEFLYGWIDPYIHWGKYGDVVMFVDEYFVEYMRWISDPERPALDPFKQQFLAFHNFAEITASAEGIRRKLLHPRPTSATPLSVLRWSFYCLGEWRKAMEVVEEMIDLYPQTDELFEWWVEYATKVYRKGALPTKFLLVQNPKIPHSSRGMSALKKVKGFALPLRFKNGHHYVPLSRLALLVGWKIEREGKEILVKTQDREVRLEVESRMAYVNGFKVKLNGFVWEEGKEVWLPLQFVVMIGKGKLKWEKGKGFIQMVLPE
jgi:tetratricopeptide (TPR) repeat protein